MTTSPPSSTRVGTRTITVCKLADDTTDDQGILSLMGGRPAGHGGPLFGAEVRAAIATLCEETDPLRVVDRLRGRGDRPGTLAVARIGDGHLAWLVEAARQTLEGDGGFEPPTSSL